MTSFFLPLQMGTLYGGQKTYNGLKCLVAASFSRKNLKQHQPQLDDSSDVIMTFQPHEDNADALLKNHPSRSLTDPLAITWYLASNEAVFGGNENYSNKVELLVLGRFILTLKLAILFYESFGLFHFSRLKF